MEIEEGGGGGAGCLKVAGSSNNTHLMDVGPTTRSVKQVSPNK